MLRCAWIAGGPAGRAAVHAAPEAHRAVLPAALRQPACSRGIAAVSPRAPPQGCFHGVPQRRSDYSPLVGSAPGALSVTLFNCMLLRDMFRTIIAVSPLLYSNGLCIGTSFLTRHMIDWNERFLYPETASCVGTDQRGLPCAASGSRDSASHARAAVIWRPRLVLNVFCCIIPLSTIYICLTKPHGTPYLLSLLRYKHCRRSYSVRITQSQERSSCNQ